MCVCFNANPLHYYVLRVPRFADKWRHCILFSIHAHLGQTNISVGMMMCVIYRRPETVGVRTRMVYGLDDIWPYYNRGRMWPKFLDIYLTVERKPRKNLNQEINPTEDRTQARCVRSNVVTPRPQRWSICKCCVWFE